MSMATIWFRTGVAPEGPKAAPNAGFPGLTWVCVFGSAPSETPGPVIEQTYRSCVAGLYADGCQSTPPSEPGSSATNDG